MHQAIAIGLGIDGDKDRDEENQYQTPEYRDGGRGESKEMPCDAAELVGDALSQRRLLLLPPRLVTLRPSLFRLLLLPTLAARRIGRVTTLPRSSRSRLGRHLLQYLRYSLLPFPDPRLNLAYRRRQLGLQLL
jgi:hypothetical protein